MKAKTSKILEFAVNRGVRLGLDNANRYEEPPSEHEIITNVTESVLFEISKWFQIGDDPAEEQSEV